MSDEPRRRDWAITFLGRLCLIGWVCAILYEAFHFLGPVRQVSLLFGPWACVIALLNALALLLIRRQGIFLFFLLVAIPPTIHFGFVLKNIAVAKNWLSAPHSHSTEGHDDDLSSSQGSSEATPHHGDQDR